MLGQASTALLPPCDKLDSATIHHRDCAIVKNARSAIKKTIMASLCSDEDAVRGDRCRVPQSPRDCPPKRTQRWLISIQDSEQY